MSVGSNPVRRLTCRISVFMWWLPLLLVSTSVSLAQIPTATILGTIRDSSGAAVPNARVTASATETGRVRTTLSGANGSYRFAALPVGNYEIRAEHEGFRAEVRSGVTLTVSQDAVINFTLQVGAVAETISVTAEAPIVNTTSSSLGALVGETEVADLPLNGRNFTDLTLLQTGISIQEKKGASDIGFSGTWFSSSGAPPRSNNYLLDGAPMVSLVGGSASSATGTTLGVEGIREYRVITNSFSAEYGMTMGSQMIIATKSGTNNFHGTLFEYLRNSALDARNFFDYQTDRRLPAFARNQFGGSLGGPIKTDRVFFYGVYEGLREALGTTNILDVIDPAYKVDGGLVPNINPLVKPILDLIPDPNIPGNQYTYPFSQPTRQDYEQGRVDFTISDSDNLFARYTADDDNRNAALALPDFQEEITSKLRFATLSENHIFSPTLLGTTRLSQSVTAHRSYDTKEVTGPEYGFVPGLPLGGVAIGGVTTFGGSTNLPSDLTQKILTFSEDMVYTAGSHSLKYGTLINAFQQHLFFPNYRKGRARFSNVAAFLRGEAREEKAGSPGSNVLRTFEYTTLGFYIQDDFQVLPTLTLNLGFRYEFMTQPMETQGLGANVRDVVHDTAPTLGPPFENPSLKNLSPRFGFAWDVNGDGRTAVRGGFGLLYDLGNMGTALLLMTSANPPFSTQSSLQNVPLTIPFEFPPDAQGRSLRGPDYHLQQPHMLHYNVAVQRELPYDMSMTLAYAGSRGLNLVQLKDGNPTVPEVLPDGRLYWSENASRVNPYWDFYYMLTGAGNSWYNSLQFQLEKRLSNGLQFQSSYTWSKVIDETQGQAPADGTPQGTAVCCRDIDRGPAEFDITQNWRFNTIYHLPEHDYGSATIGKALNGWWLSGILSLSSGRPFSPSLTESRSRAFVQGSNDDRPNLLPGRKAENIILGGPDRYFDPTAFSIQPAGFLGTAGRDILRGPGLANVDFSLVKDTALGFLGDSGKLEFRAEFFNIFNRANFSQPNNQVYAGRSDVENPLSNVGRVTSTETTSRQIQLALKLVF